MSVNVFVVVLSVAALAWIAIVAVSGWLDKPPDPTRPPGWTAICADPVDEHHRTLPDLSPWLPPDVELEPTQADELIAEIEAFLKERSQ